MTIDIRETLHDIGDTVVPPAVDHSAFEGRVRRARRRRSTSRLATAAASVVVVGVTAWLVSPGGGDGRPELAADPSEEAPSGVLAFEQEGTLHLSARRPDIVGTSRDTGILVEEVVAQVPGGVVYVGPESHVMQVYIVGERVVGEPRDLAGPGPVQWAAVDATDTSLWFVDLRNVLHRRAVGSPTDDSIDQLTAATTVLAVGVDSWVDTVDGERLVLHTPEGNHPIVPRSKPLSAAIGGTTLAVRTVDQTWFWSLTDGQPIAGSTGLGTTALSPDGRLLASGSDDLDRDAGVQGLYVDEIRAELSHPVTLPDDTGPVIDIWWENNRRFFVVVETSAEGRLIHTLYECVVGSGCEYRIEDETGTLQLPRG